MERSHRLLIAAVRLHHSWGVGLEEEEEVEDEEEEEEEVGEEEDEMGGGGGGEGGAGGGHLLRGVGLIITDARIPVAVHHPAYRLSHPPYRLDTKGASQGIQLLPAPTALTPHI
ncbi:LOW QUALITY PROTEIN: hypothetical protein CRUP_034730, partial [Coryphaenoides rupestris]